MQKILFVLIAFIMGITSSYAQLGQENLNKFTNSFYRYYYPNSNHFENDDSSILTTSFIIIPVNKNFTIDSIYLSDSAPSWQIEELKLTKQKLNLNALALYAKQNKFVGKFIFPLVLKSEVLVGAIEQTKVFSTFNNLLLCGGLPISDSLRFEKPIVIVERKRISKNIEK